jgi:hypothetical protein
MRYQRGLSGAARVVHDMELLNSLPVPFHEVKFYIDYLRSHTWQISRIGHFGSHWKPWRTTTRVFTSQLHKRIYTYIPLFPCLPERCYIKWHQNKLQQMWNLSKDVPLHNLDATIKSWPNICNNGQFNCNLKTLAIPWLCFCHYGSEIQMNRDLVGERCPALVW